MRPPQAGACSTMAMSKVQAQETCAARVLLVNILFSMSYGGFLTA
jgi:hypothetical protein